MIDNLVQWATLLSPIISVIAIVVALKVAHSSSKDAQKQIAAIRHLLDVFVAANNLDIVERKFSRLWLCKKKWHKKSILISYWPSIGRLK